MDTTKAQQKELDDALVAPKNCLKIEKCNQRLSPTLKSNEPTIQVALDALKLTPFYNAFEVSADVPEIYMQEFWATVTKHHFSLHFKMNGKSHTVNGMYHNKNVDYVYLLWEELVYQVENKNSKKNNDMYYLCFTKVIVDYFMAKDQAIPRRNKMFWHYARDDFMFTTIRVISKHQDTQVYDAILPQHLTNQAMLESEAYKTYLAYTTSEKIPKPKYGKNKADSESSPKKKTATTAKGKRLKTLAKEAKPEKKHQHAKTSKAKGLTMLSEVALTEADQMKIATKRSLIETHSYYANGSGNEEDDDEVGLNDNDDDNDDDEDNDDDDDDADNQDDDQEDDGQDDEDQDDVNEQIDSGNDGDDFVHPKLSTQDQEVRHNEEESDEEIQGMNVEEEELDEEETNDEDEANELYKDLNVNLEGRDIEMTDAQQTNVQTTQVIEDTHVIITPVNLEGQQQSSSVSSEFVSNMLNPSPDTGIDSIFNLNTESNSLIDVPVTTIAEPPLLSTTTLPLPPTLIITHLQQTPVPTPAIVLSSSLQDLPNFGSLFGFDHRLKTLENNFSEFNQTNQFAVAFSLIPGSELKTSELDTSELKTSDYRFLKIFILASYEQELCQFNFLLASCQLSSSELHIASYRLIEDKFLACYEQELCPFNFLPASCQVSSSELHPASYRAQQRIRLYCRGKENGVQNDLESILTCQLEDKERYDADIRATNILLQGLSKDIYSLINHYTDAKDIWDNVKMFLEEWGRFVTVVKLNRGLRDSNYDQLYAYLKQHEAYANENKMMLERFTQPNVDPLALISNVSHQQYNSQSSINPSSTYVPPHFIDNSQLD
ncbi:hypothetical protein Tco_0924023 [Tanacetum coccineum]|uniref:Uncharacterized protein n=1 Tax=Tanacetum coccineum TaxID=301880 RepID=A0ABQ5D3N0_9ASTR